MKRNCLLAIAVIAFITSTPAQAQTWSQEITVTSAFTEDSDAIIIYRAGSLIMSAGVFQILGISPPPPTSAARACATILTTLATGMKIKFWVAGDCSAYSFHHATAVMLVR